LDPLSPLRVTFVDLLFLGIQHSYTAKLKADSSRSYRAKEGRNSAKVAFLRLAEQHLVPIKHPSAFHVAYYCKPCLPLLNPSSNGQKADLHSDARLFAAITGPLFAGNLILQRQFR
jgi:hypothetical protein